MAREIVFIGCPSHDGRVDAESATEACVGASRTRTVVYTVNSGSLLAMNCNILWAAAHNSRHEHGTKWFAMLHADVVPRRGWLDALIGIAHVYEADMVSAVVPIKDSRGYTSHAIDNPADPWTASTRITMKQLNHPMMPDVFDGPAAVSALRSMPGKLGLPDLPVGHLLCNTGCMVARLDRDWSRKVCFEIRDRIIERDGMLVPQVQPEDWVFSRAIAEMGGRVLATKLVKVIHKGHAEFESASEWGNDRDAIYDLLYPREESREDQ